MDTPYETGADQQATVFGRIADVSEHPFVKGHGTENDFVLLPDATGQLELSPDDVRRICDRRAGIGADGVIRVVRTDATDDPDAVAARGEAIWFMDYRNSDGSLSQMCGNGIRALARYLSDHADVNTSESLKIATRAGIKTVFFTDNDITVEMGLPKVHSDTRIWVGDREWSARHVDMGNPHAVAFVDSLEDAGSLTEEPGFDETVYPEGVNVEFVQRVGERHVAMRVHERGSGETRSCGTGACAAMVAASLADGSDRGLPYRVDVPGGSLTIVWADDGQILMTGPAVLVAEGITGLLGQGPA